MKAIINFFLSLKTGFGIFLAIALLMFIGSLSLPYNLAFFSGIDDTRLFAWLSASGQPGITWWIYGVIFMLAALAVNTIFCTVRALLRGRFSAYALAPQIMHIGALTIMLGNLLTASTGFKSDVLLTKGQRQEIKGGFEVYLEDVRAVADESGYYSDWEVKLHFYEGGSKKGEGVVGPLRPAYHGGLGVYSKSVDMENGPSALLRVTRDTGAVWALIGGALLSLGGIVFVRGRLAEP